MWYYTFCIWCKYMSKQSAQYLPLYLHHIYTHVNTKFRPVILEQPLRHFVIAWGEEKGSRKCPCFVKIRVLPKGVGEVQSTLTTRAASTDMWYTTVTCSTWYC